jgi:hypothetical protein
MKKLYRSLWYFWHLPRIVRILPVLVLTGCVTPRLTPTPSVAVVHLTVGDGGYYASDFDHETLLSEGIPASFFVLRPKGWWMSAGNEVKAADIIFARRNPGVVNQP